MIKPLALVLSFVALLAAVPAHAQRSASIIVGSFDPAMTEEELAARAPDRSPGITHEYHRLHAPNDGRNVSVFEIILGEEGVRIKNIRKYASAGFVAYPVAPIEECAFDIASRTDAVAVALQAAEAAQQAAAEAHARLDAAAQALAEAQAAEDAAAQTLAAAEAASAATGAKQLAAHEAAHVVQQRAGVALRTAQSSPTPKNLQALASALADLNAALRAQAKADADAAQAAAAATRFRQEFGQVQATRKERLAAFVPETDEAGNEDKNAEAARAAAGKRVNAEIAATAEEVAEESRALAENLAAVADFLAHAKASYGGKSGIGSPQWAQLGEDEATAMAAAALAAKAYKTAEDLAVRSLQLPPIPATATAAEAAQFPQFQLLGALLDAIDEQTVNAMVLSLGVVGGGPLQSAATDALSAVKTLCNDGSCDPSALDALTTEAESIAVTALQTAHQNESRRFQALSNVSRNINDGKRGILSVIR